MLPHEIFTLVLLFAKAVAIPQGLPIERNATTTTTTTTTTTSHPLTERSKKKIHQESTATGWEETVQPKAQSITWDGCAPNGCHESTVHSEASETGWLSPITSIAPGQSNTPQSTHVLKQELVSTHIPSLVGIRTEIQPTPQYSIARPEATPDTSPTFAKFDPAPASPQETPAPNPLLEDIISKLGIHPSHAPPASETPTAASDISPPQPVNTNALPPLLTSGFQITSPPQITLGPTTLTLTPGLTSLLGAPPSATYIALATNDQGQTLLTVSASGTAVTATIEDVATVVTREASITGVVGKGGDEDVVTRRSKGVGVRGEVGGWIGWGVVWWVVMV